MIISPAHPLIERCTSYPATVSGVTWPIGADPQVRPAWAPSFPRDET
jgi:hypothetical protein